MFTSHKCSNPSCMKSAISSIDLVTGEIKDVPGFCLEHCEDREAREQEIIQYIKTHEKIVGLTACGLCVENMDFSGKKFYGCNFQKTTFLNIQSKDCRFRMSFFDFSIFSDCNLLNSNMQFSSFAGSTFSHVLFTGSDLIHNNFCGISAYQSSYDDCDLYNSRFIGASFHYVSFRNCNLKNTNFMNIAQENVSYKLSNTRAAIFDQEIVEEKDDESLLSHVN